MAVLMRFNNDCGVPVVATVTGQTYERVRDLWPGKFRGDISDSLIHHQGVLSRLGFRYKTRSVEDIIAGRCEPMRTAILLNAQDDPATLLREDLLIMHWVVLQGVRGGNVWVYWMDGTQRPFQFESLRKHMTNPFSVAYEVEEGSQKLPWYKRWYKRITSWLGSLW